MGKDQEPTLQVPVKLSAKESAVIRIRLIQEIEIHPDDDLRHRAIAILKEKNRLWADDAKRVENAFAARLAPQSDLNEQLSTDEPNFSSVAVILPELPSAPTTAIKPRQPRGRPRKTKAPIAKAASVARTPKTVDAPNMRPSPDLNASTVIRIDKSMLRFGELRRHRNKTHLRFVAMQPCLVCGRAPSDPHHLRFAQPRALARKTSDEFVVPLCRAHHRQNHQTGDEIGWWKSNRIDPMTAAGRLWAISRGIGTNPNK